MTPDEKDPSVPAYVEANLDDSFEAVADEPAEGYDVPAGGAGADSGAAPAVDIDPDDEAGVSNVSSSNDIPGVGTRGADGGMEVDRD